jgi:hypothetical protein
MDVDELIGLVREMRRLQREFFRTGPRDRPPDLIRRAKDAERAVDAELARLQAGMRRLFE